MIFAQYNGIRKDLTKGRIYLARPGINDGETVGLDCLTINSDPGPAIQIDPKNNNFEYLEEVYAVLVCPVPEENLKPGEVVIINDAVEDIQMNLFRVKDVGLYRASNFVLLDRTNVFPGLVVMDAATGHWVTVRRVNECLWFRANGSRIYRSPEKFKFAVSEGDILTEPLIKCIDNVGEPELTKGNLYRLKETHEDIVSLADDSKNIRNFMLSRFEINY